MQSLPLLCWSIRFAHSKLYDELWQLQLPLLSLSEQPFAERAPLRLARLRSSPALSPSSPTAQDAVPD